MSELVTPAVPPRHKTAKDYIYDQLTTAFLGGRFSPGERLLEKDISEWLEVSRTPVREALSALESDGLVELVPHKGAIVRRLTADDVRDQYVVRAALESLATELAVPRITPDLLATLKLANEEFANANERGDLDEAIMANRRLHMTLYRASESRRLVETIESAWRRADYFRRFVYSSSEGSHRENDMHAELLTAVQAGDALAASELVKRSLLEGGNLLAEDIARGAPSGDEPT